VGFEIQVAVVEGEEGVERGGGEEGERGKQRERGRGGSKGGGGRGLVTRYLAISGGGELEAGFATHGGG
jgi:hypothetical protein